MPTHTLTHIYSYIQADLLPYVYASTGLPVVQRYWQESNVAGEWIKPDQSSGVTVETTAYVMLATVLKVP